jgi:hypothetical protein
MTIFLTDFQELIKRSQKQFYNSFGNLSRFTNEDLREHLGETEVVKNSDKCEL